MFSTIAKLIAAFMRTLITLIVIAVLVPLAYFGYRLTQPLDMPQFKGLSYIQFAAWRADFLTAQAQKYLQQNPHPHSMVTTWQCDNGNKSFDTLRALSSGLYVFVEDVSMVRAKGDWSHILGFPSQWFGTFEQWVWSGAEAQQINFPNVSFCNLNLSKIPTPVQLQDASINQ